MSSRTYLMARHSSSKQGLKLSAKYRDAPLKPSIGFSSSGSKRSPPTMFEYSFDLKSESLTITGFGAKAAASVAMPSASLWT